MATGFVFFIFTVVNVAIVFTTSLSWNVHEEMTVDEISDTFDTDDGSVPDYQVFHMPLSTTRRRRQAEDIMSIKVMINGREVNLNFKATDGYLASKNTSVRLAVTDPNAHQSILYYPDPNAMREIGDFKMYHDVENEAAIVIYKDPDHDFIIEGVVTSDYALKTLPKRLWNKTLNVRFSKPRFWPSMNKRSIEPDADEVTGCYVLFKVSEHAKQSAPTFNHRVRRQLSRGRRRTPPEVVYPEILIVLDHNSIRRRSITTALRFVLAFWNAVDMVYSRLSKPKVRLNIAGIIVSADDAATPYIAENTSKTITGKSNLIPYNMGSYFYKEQARFPLNKYDIIIAMTRMTLCVEEVSPCTRALGHARYNSACASEQLTNTSEIIWPTGVVYYNWMFDGVSTAAHETAHIFGVDHDDGNYHPPPCHHGNGYVMSRTNQYSHQTFKWSICSEIFFREHFLSENSTCFDNEPVRTEPATDVLPREWLEVDQNVTRV